MKFFYTLIISFALFPSISLAKVNSGQTVYSLFSEYDQKMASQMPERYKKLSVEKLQKSPEYLAFEIKGFPFIFKWVAKENVAMTLNGHEITFKQLKDRKLLRQRIVSVLLKRKKRKVSLIDWIFPQAQARVILSDIAFANLLQGINVQPNYSAFSSALFGGHNFSGAMSQFVNFLTLGSSMFGGNANMLTDTPESLELPSSRSSLLIPSVSEDVSAKTPDSILTAF